MNIKRKLNQMTTYWGAPAGDGRGGFTYAAPATKLRRWQDIQEIFTDVDGEEKLSTAIVYDDTDMDMNGSLFLGTSAVTDPMAVSGARKIRAKGSSTNVSGRQTLYKFWLV